MQPETVRSNCLSSVKTGCNSPSTTPTNTIRAPFPSQGNNPVLSLHSNTDFFYVLLTVHPNKTIVFCTNLMHKLFLSIYLLHSSTCFEHYCADLQEDKLRSSTRYGHYCAHLQEDKLQSSTCFEHYCAHLQEDKLQSSTCFEHYCAHLQEDKLRSSTCFEHHCAHLQEDKLHSSTCFEHYCAHPQQDSCINTATGTVTLFR